MSTLIRFLKLAEVSYKRDKDFFNKICLYFDAFARKYKMAHFEPKNDGSVPVMWRKNLDYAGHEKSPYYGDMASFLKEFPEGIRDWVKMREKTQKERNLKYAPKKSKAHYEPVGEDQTEKFPDEPKIYSGEMDKFKDVKEFLEKRKEMFGQSADDSAMRAITDFINYWKLLRKEKK